MTGSPARPFGLLIAAHGERAGGGENEGVARLAAALNAHGIAAAAGFVKGTPSIAEAVRRLPAGELLVYPLFLADGYFARSVLPRQLAEAGRGHAEILPPLGHDPALPGLIAERAGVAARSRGWSLECTHLVLLAHGSRRDPGSRRTAEHVARRIAASRRFAGHHIALLDELPRLDHVAARLSAPVVVAGLFVGEGLHGGADAPRLVARLARADVAFAGNVGTFDGLSEMIVTTVFRWRQGTESERRVSGPC